MWNQLDLLIDRKTQESEREFYGLIGLVAVRFASLEEQLTNLLGAFIHPQDQLLTETLTEDIFLVKTIELLRKIGKIRSVDDALLDEIIADANYLRKDRNDYIHGIWKIKTQDDGNTIATCSRKRISFKQNGLTKQWKRDYNSKNISIDTLRNTAIKLDSISKKIQVLIKKIEDDPQEYDF